MRRRGTASFVLLATLALTAAHGQDDDAAADSAESADAQRNPAVDLLESMLLAGAGVATPNDDQRDRDTVDVLRAALKSPETLNKVVDSFVTTDSGWQLLKDIDFEFKVFDSNDGAEPGLGFSFDYQRELTNHDLMCSEAATEEGCIRGLSLSFDTSGTVAFDEDENPTDLITAQLDFDYFRSKGGRALVDADAVAVLEQAFVDATTPEGEEAAIGQIVNLVRPSLTNQFYYGFGGDVSLESNQTFTTKQTLYGVHIAVDFKDWSGTSAWSTFNFFDYPFAALRALTGYDCDRRGSAEGVKPQKCFQPSGTAWPTLLFRASRVQPEEDDPRALAGDTSDYTRLDFEASFRSAVAKLAGDELYITLNYRRYEERDPSQLVQAANLDRFKYFTITIGGDDGMYVSYADGKLPLAFADDQVVELGFKTHL
jgi:hypothetical protein